ncbi:MAG: replication initiator protein [Microviridae sp.]|nr:MAG: replication initiator protein [Microviridae sp.]
MPCYHPLPGWFSRTINASGKRSIVFNIRDGQSDLKAEIPCGRCLGCRLERSRQWAIRCMHEARLHPDNCFITLTYDEDHAAQLPFAETGRPGLDPRHFVLFMKRLRKAYGEGIRFFQCGEYGEQTLRPHHHALLFNHRFPDQRVWNTNSKHSTYVSESLESLWGHGLCSIDEVNFATASYVARYSMKKIYGPEAEAHYQGRQPEYLTMSRRPGIGSGFFDKYEQEIYNRDSCLVNAKEVKPPSYYDDKLAKLDNDRYLLIKDARKLAATSNANNKPARLRVRERTATHRLKQYSERKKL